jgi:hypothetical protein
MIDFDMVTLTIVNDRQVYHLLLSMLPYQSVSFTIVNVTISKCIIYYCQCYHIKVYHLLLSMLPYQSVSFTIVNVTLTIVNDTL